jgi:signal transduction histidine kinase/ligand-binding sensor domain-containing protein
LRAVKNLFWRLACLSLPVFYGHPAISQNFNPYYNFKHISVENGLAQNIVYHFLQDSRGYVWLGTRDGITIYDGLRTINFRHDENDGNSLGGNLITRILEDSDHRVWIGNDAGIDLYNRSNNNFTHFGIPGSNGQPENDYCVPLGFSDSVRLWFIDTKYKAIVIFNTKTRAFKSVATTDAPDGALYYNPAQHTVHIWTYLGIGTSHLVFTNDSLIKQEHLSDYKAGNDADLRIIHVYPESDSAVWLSSDRGLIELNPISHGYQLFHSRGNEQINEIRYVTRSPKKLLWVATGGYGIYTFNTETKQFVDNFRNYALDPYSVCSNNIVSIYFDKVGNVWCGSYGDGASYAHVENNSFSKNLSKKEMDAWKAGNNVLHVSQDKKRRIWCVLNDFLGYWLLDSAMKVIELKKPLLENGKPFSGPTYKILFDGPDFAWCATDRGLYRYNIVSNQLRQVPFQRFSSELFGSYWINDMIPLHDGSFLFSTWAGLYRIDRENGKEIIKPFPVLNDLAFKSFDALFEDSEHNIYVADQAHFIYILADSSATGNYSLKKKLFTGDLFQVAEEGSDIYLVLRSGLSVLNKKSWTIERSFLNNLIPPGSITNLLIEKNKFWLFSERGLYLFNKEEKKGRLFTVEDGLPSNKFSETCLVTMESGKCIAGTDNGLLIFYPDRFQDFVYPPRAQLINLFVNDSTRGFLANPMETSPVILAHDQNTFSLDFSGISFQHASSNTYEYKLDPYDEKWISSGTVHYTRYSKIPPGKYSFLLRVIDARGQVSPYTKRLDIEIRKAFWQTGLFKFIVAALIGLIIWLLIKWWLNVKIKKQLQAFEKQQAIEKERTRIATDMHDDLGAGLSRIKFLSETIGLKKQQQQPVEEDISSIGEYANEMIGKMGEIVWALNEKNDSLSDLLSYTRSYAVEYLLQNSIRCDVHAPPEFPDIFVSGEFRRNIYLTIKEALHNIVKHAEAGAVTIVVRIDGALSISIHDDGTGFDPTRIRPFSNGLNNMKKRMQDIGGRLEIKQKPGTTIHLWAPLPV